MKSYTDIEQSKVLAKILPLESADMYYWCGEDLRIGGHKAMVMDFDIPCWSLAALLEILPKHIKLIHGTSETPYCLKFDYQFDNYKIYYISIYDSLCDHYASIYLTLENKSFVDACVETICELHKKNLI